MIVHNPLIRNPSAVGDIFNAAAFGGELKPGKFYRPIQILSYAFDYNRAGLDPAAFRFTSITLHAITSLAVYAMLSFFGVSGALRLILVALYTVHPVHIESVTYLSGRGDVLAMCFGMLSLNFILRVRQHWGYVFAAIACFALGILSKENTVYLAGLAVLYPLYKHKLRSVTVREWVTAVVMAIGAVAFVTWRLNLVSDVPGISTTLSAISHATLAERWLTIPYNLFMSIKLVILPYPLHMEYHWVEETITSLSFWVYSSAVIAYWGILYFFSLNKRETTFFLLWWLGSMFPFLHILTPLASTFREHWAEWAVFILVIPLAKVLHKFYTDLEKPPLKGAARGAVLLLICSLMGVTIHRNADWMDAKKLYAHDLKYEPESFLLHNNLGIEYYREGDLKTAKHHFLNSINASPNKSYSVAHNNVGAVYRDELKLQKAEFHFRQSIINSRYVLAYENIVDLYISYDYLDEAQLLLTEGLGRYPRNRNLQRLQEVLNEKKAKDS